MGEHQKAASQLDGCVRQSNCSPAWSLCSQVACMAWLPSMFPFGHLRRPPSLLLIRPSTRPSAFKGLYCRLRACLRTRAPSVRSLFRSPRPASSSSSLQISSFFLSACCRVCCASPPPPRSLITPRVSPVFLLLRYPSRSLRTSSLVLFSSPSDDLLLFDFGRSSPFCS